MPSTVKRVPVHAPKLSTTDYVDPGNLPRVPRAQMPATSRLSTRIKAGMIVGRLQRHIEGKLDMSSTQIQAARILLNKVLPDLRSVAVVPQGPAGDPRGIDAAYLLSIIEGHAERVEDGRRDKD